MFGNEKWQESAISKRLYDNCKGHVKSSHVLCIHDTSEINYTGHIGRIGKEEPFIGPVTKNTNAGFYCHPMLVVDAQEKIPLGFSYVKTWNRKWDKPHKKERKYTSLPIEDKESYRWIESARESLKSLPSTVRQTVIGDRESDIYEALCLIPYERTDLLIRSSSNRCLKGEERLLLEKMQSLPNSHTYDLAVKGNHSRKNRGALMQLRYGKVELSKPADLKGNYPSSLSIYCIYAVEHPDTVPANEAPIEWRLLTTHPVESIQEALQCIEWYKLRWFIEEIFRLLKSEGLNVEGAQLESGEALKKTCINGTYSSLAYHVSQTSI